VHRNQAKRRAGGSFAAAHGSKRGETAGFGAIVGHEGSEPVGASAEQSDLI